MRFVIQRVTSARVLVAGNVVGACANGLLILAGIAQGDRSEEMLKAVQKVLNMRLFADGEKKFHLSALETRAELLLVSQFTLCADTNKGRRPEFFNSMPPAPALDYFNSLIAEFKKSGLRV